MVLKVKYITLVFLVLCILGPPQLKVEDRNTNTRELASQLAFESSFNLDFSNILRMVVWGISGLIVLVYFSKNKKYYYDILTSNPTKWYSIYGLFAIISSIYSPNTLYTLFFSFQILILILLVGLIQKWMDWTKPLLLIFYAFIIQLFLIIIFYFIDPNLVGREEWNYGYRLVGGIFGDYGAAAVISGIYFITVCLHGKEYLSDARLKIYWICYFITWIFLLLTFTRSSMIAAILVLFINIFIYKKFIHKALFIYISFGVVIVSGVLGYFDNLILYFSRGQSIDVIMTLSARAGVFEFLFNRWLESPIVGYGYAAGSRWLLAEFVRDGIPLGSAHNAILKVLADLGIIGFIILSMSYIITIKSLFKNRIFNNESKKLKLLYAQIVSLFIYVSISSVFGVGIAAGSSIYIVIIMTMVMVIKIKRLRI
ncbi:O-antigen ligase domain-containing protein [Rhodohalobacter sp. SW132]|uniref:O-antigen ligase family protein n=1 Tax=Rhodohalobacter sp. SW132 TaxID=2293433 RepID=UPI000E23ABE0|nr:O-antigen ligase family protein [Rhodohalobacter sp. SW132]REL37540.1 O-antigen ligase domain-containing protein [Rhodohalobacter sp. SW132]